VKAQAFVQRTLYLSCMACLPRLNREKFSKGVKAVRFAVQLRSLLLIFGACCADVGAASLTNGIDGYIDAVSILPDGDIVIAGQFTTIGGLKRPSLARIHADGRLDPTLNPALPASSRVDAMTVQPDGKIIVGGYFPDSAAPEGAYTLLRLAVDGAVDTVGAQPEGSPSVLSMQTDGKVLVGGGSVNQIDNQTRLHIARLNSDLTLDPVFQPSVPPDGNVYTLEEESDGSILIAGYFKTIADPMREIFANSVARVDSGGNVDPSFVLPVQYQGDSAYYIYAAHELPSGKIIVGGDYELTGVGATTTSLHDNDGSLDTADFTPATIGGPTVLTVQADGKILIGGVFNDIGNATNQLARDNIGRLNANGLPDSQFVAQTNSGPSGQVIAIAQQSDGNIVLGGAFTQVDGQTRNGVARVLANGALDSSFNVTDDIFSGTFDP
jgi:uncharacterized delta-60 repeat protein